MMTGAERARARNDLYLYALGPLSLRHEDLWEITNGQLADMIDAHKYKQWLECREQAIHTAVIANMWTKKRITPQDIAGIWKQGRILSKGQFLEEWKAARRRKKGG